MPRDGGEYEPGSGPSLPNASGDNIEYYYFRFGSGQTCTYPSALSAIGSSISGVIGFSRNTSSWWAFSSACDNVGTALNGISDLGIADYAVENAIYNGHFYRFYPTPPLASGIKNQRFLCRRITSPVGAPQEGIDVAIWNDGSEAQASIIIGKGEAGKFYRSIVDPFTVSESQPLGSRTVFHTNSFDLTVDTLGGAPFTGELIAEIAGQQTTLTLSCYQ